MDLRWVDESGITACDVMDLRDLRRIADVSGVVDSREAAATVQGLGWHEVLYVNSRTGMLAVTKPPPL